MQQRKYPLPDSGAEAAAQVITELLVQRRKELNLTQEQLAERMGVGKSTVSKIEARKWNLSLEYFINWCYALECNPYIQSIGNEDPVFQEVWQNLGRRIENESKK